MKSDVWNIPLTLFARTTPAKHIAFDTTWILSAIPKQLSISAMHQYIEENPQSIQTTIGFKNAGPPIKFIFRSHTIEGASFLPTGYIPGPGESAEMREIPVFRKFYQDNLAAISQGEYVPAPHVKQAINRAIKEEITARLIRIHNRPISAETQKLIDLLFDETGGLNRRCYFIGIHDRKRRDRRYVSHNLGDVTIGYDRDSVAYYFAAVSSFPTEVRDIFMLDKPEDTCECSQARLIDFQELRNELRIGGKYEPAFPSHTELLDMLDIGKLMWVDQLLLESE